MQMKSVLVVEDDQDILENVVIALNIAGYPTHAAENGKLALRFLYQVPEQDLPGCILLDLMMPEMNGFEFIEHLQMEKIFKIKKIPIIIMSAKDNLSYFIKEKPEYDVLKKPFELEQLYSVVKKYCLIPEKIQHA